MESKRWDLPGVPVPFQLPVHMQLDHARYRHLDAAWELMNLVVRLVMFLGPVKLSGGFLQAPLEHLVREHLEKEERAREGHCLGEERPVGEDWEYRFRGL